MAADIILYEPTKVPVGEDQRQHLELTIDLIHRINTITDLDIKPPKVFKSEHQRVMSLTNASNKMSKSDRSARSRINIIDDPEMIREKIKRAKTDTLGEITFDSQRPGRFLIIIFRAIQFTEHICKCERDRRIKP